MTITDKNTAIMNWLYGCNELQDIFYLVGKAENGGTTIVPNSSEEWTKQFSDGTGEKELTFTLVMYKPVSSEPNSNENARTQYDVEKAMEWIREQNEVENFPQFADNEAIFEIEVLENQPNMAGQDKDTAKFMFAVKINYYKGE